MTDASELEKIHNKPKQIIGLKQNILQVGLLNGHKSTGYFFFVTYSCLFVSEKYRHYFVNY